MNIFSIIKSHVPILDVIQEHTTLKKNGSYWKGCCPFHHERTASFTVSPHKEIFYCFGCHVTGDIISFIAKVEHCSPLEAARYLAECYNIALPNVMEKESDYTATHQNKNVYFTLCSIVANWAYDNLQKNTTLIEYLRQRGFTLDIIKHFCIGYFPGGSLSIKQFLDHMRTKNILAQDLIEANVIIQGKGSLYSPFEERILFPIKDSLGRFCGFGGRIFKHHDDRPKYYNSKENEFFTKGSLLFGLDSAKKSMQERNTVFLVEGYTDCMAMVQHGFSNTVATLGTACTPQHLKTLSRYVQRIYVLYDNDKAGQQAIIRLAQLCWQVDLELNVIELPNGQDPASWLQSHHRIDPFIEQAKDIFLFFINTLGKDFPTKLISEKVRIVRTVTDLIRTIKDTLKQDFLLQKAAYVFDIPLQSLKEEFARSPNNAMTATHKDETSIHGDNDINTINQVTQLEKQLFCTILGNIPSINAYSVQCIVSYLPEQLKTILQQLQISYNHNPLLTCSDFLHTLASDERQWATKALFENTDTGALGHLDQLVYQVQKIHWKKIVRTIKQQIAHAHHVGNSTEVTRLVQDFLSLKKTHSDVFSGTDR